jgi:hypothetical protein
MPLDDDQKIPDCLDGNWRTISQIRTRLRYRRTDGKLSSTLLRLADTGRIERHGLETIAPTAEVLAVLRKCLRYRFSSRDGELVSRDSLDPHQHLERGRRRGSPQGLCQRGSGRALICRA